MFKSYQFDGSLAMSSCHRSVSSRGQDQRHPLPKPSWHLHGAPSRTDLIFVGARRKRWSALRVAGGRKGHAGRLDRVDNGSKSKGQNLVVSFDGDLRSCGVREGNGVCREMEMTCRCRWPGTRGFWGQPGMFPTRRRFT